MKIFDRSDASLALALIAGMVVVFQKPFHLLMDATRDVEVRYNIDLLPGLIVLVGAFGFHQYRKHAQARIAHGESTADAARERRRAAELERLVALGAALAAASDHESLRQVFWRYLPSFARGRELWLAARTGENLGGAPRCGAAHRPSGRDP